MFGAQSSYFEQTKFKDAMSVQLFFSNFCILSRMHRAAENLFNMQWFAPYKISSGRIIMQNVRCGPLFVTDVPWSVSVCLSVCHSREP